MRSTRVLATLLAAGLALTGCDLGSGSSAPSEDYPSQEIRLIVPYTAGGPTDLLARALGEYMQGELGQTVVVENLPGATGATAYQELISAEPDGYTLSLTALPSAVLNYLFNDVGYTGEDFAPIGVLAQIPSAIVVPRDSPYTDLESLFAAAVATPDSVTVGTPGATNTHAAETLRITQLYDIPLTVVPFEGQAEVQTALLGGNVTAGFINVAKEVLPLFESGDLRVLAVGSEEELPYLEGTTLVELGYPELTQSTSTFGLLAPADTPEEIVATLEDTLRAATQDPGVIESVGADYVPAEFIDGAAFGELFVDAEDTFRDVAGG